MTLISRMVQSFCFVLWGMFIGILTTDYFSDKFILYYCVLLLGVSLLTVLLEKMRQDVCS